MIKSFEKLSQEAQEYLNSRFDDYGISGQEAYNTLVSDDAKELSSEELIDFLEQKDVSHIIPQSEAPHLANNLDNIYLEDSYINRARGAEISSDDDISIAWDDQIHDTNTLQADDSTWEQFSDSIDGIDNSLVDEIVGGSLTLGMLMSGYETRKAITNGEIQLNEVPKYFTVKTGGRTIKLAVIGFSLTSSSPIIVSAGVGYLIYKSRNLIKRLFNGAYNFATHDKTRRYAEMTINGTVIGITAVGGYTYKAITSDTSKAIAKTTLKTTGVILEESAKLTYKTGKYIGKKSIEFLTDERTINAANQTIKTTGKVVKGAAILTGSIISWGFNKLKKR